MPSYHCGVEVQAALDAGLDAGFYGLCPDLAIDEDDLGRKLREDPGPVLAIHYFGWPQPGIRRIAAMCRERGVPLIEDCAHALFSSHEGRPLGRFGTVAIFSLRKSLPVLEGGLLLAESHAAPNGRFPAAAYRLYAKAAARRVLGERLARAYRRWRFGPDAGSDEEPVPPSLERDRYQDRMAGLTRRIAASAAPEEIAAARRRNWTALDAALSRFPGYRKVFPLLPEGTCPLFLPVWVERRNALARRLAHANVETFLFGAFPHPRLEGHADARRLRDGILCLPVHQQLSQGDMARIATAAGPLLAEYQ